MFQVRRVVLELQDSEALLAHEENQVVEVLLDQADMRVLEDQRDHQEERVLQEFLDLPAAQVNAVKVGLLILHDGLVLHS